LLCAATATGLDLAASADALIDTQQALAEATPLPWSLPTTARPALIGGCFVCFARGIAGPGNVGDPAVAAVVVMRVRHELAQAVVCGRAATRYLPALLALREGPLLEATVRALASKAGTEGRPKVLQCQRRWSGMT